MGKKNRKQGPSTTLRSRNTRSTRGRLLTDTTSSNHLLTSQLRTLGLYAAPTVGDGNCLFRSLSDQLYGSPSRHAEVRKQVCDWIEQHKSRYEPFVEDERGLDVHLSCMRENATYGGHMELSAFAHLTRRNIKVIQPGLVYIIGWAAGWESTDPSSASSSASTAVSSSASSSSAISSSSTIVTRRRSQRSLNPSEKERDKQKRREKAQQGDKIRTGKHGYYVYEEVTSSSESEAEPPEQDPWADTQHPSTDEESGDTIYVAYHDWEHFSSIRNLHGPHTGLPMVRETPPQTETYAMVKEREKEVLKDQERERKKERKAINSDSPKVKLRLSRKGATPTPTTGEGQTTSSDDPSANLQVPSSNDKGESERDPALIPLPTSRAASPFPASMISTSTTTARTPAPTPLARSHVPSSEGEGSATPDAGNDLPALRTQGVGVDVAPYHARQLHLQPTTPTLRTHRSPKRTFDESSASGGEEGGSAGGGASGVEGREKRTRRNTREGEGGTTGHSLSEGGVSGDMDVDVDVDAEDDENENDLQTPALSAPGSTESSSESSGSSFGGEGANSSERTPVSPATPKKAKAKQDRLQFTVKEEKPLTRRQRKALGLPKKGPGASAGKIVIPGGRWKGRAQGVDADVAGGGDEEWRRNGAGRLDVRGFRELKI